MQRPVRITWKGIDPIAAAEQDIQERVENLERRFPNLQRCHVVVERPHHHHRQGALYQVHLDLTVPDHTLVADRHPDQHHAHEDLHVAIRDAFDALQRRLQDYARKVQRQTRQHEPRPSGRILWYSEDEGYGFIQDEAGREIYFHRNSVLDEHVERLKSGTPVRFEEEEGEEGPQASTVHVVE